MDFKSEMREVIVNSDLAKHAEHGIAQLLIYPHPECLKIEDIQPARDKELNRNIDSALSSLLALIEKKLPKEYVDYEQCCVGGHNEHNCEKNITSRVEFETHNKLLSEIKQRMGIK